MVGGACREFTVVRGHRSRVYLDLECVPYLGFRVAIKTNVLVMVVLAGTIQ